jgi:hypothetical protein
MSAGMGQHEKNVVLYHKNEEIMMGRIRKNTILDYCCDYPNLRDYGKLLLFKEEAICRLIKLRSPIKYTLWFGLNPRKDQYLVFLPCWVIR